jgi:hypothetical protein
MRAGGEEVRRLGKRDERVVTAIEKIRIKRVKAYRNDFGRAKIPKLRTIKPINRRAIMHFYLVRRYKKGRGQGAKGKN